MPADTSSPRKRPGLSRSQVRRPSQSGPPRTPWTRPTRSAMLLTSTRSSAAKRRAGSPESPAPSGSVPEEDLLMSTFVIVPGAWDTPATLEPVIEPLGSAGHDVVVVDLPCGSPDSSLEEYADAVRAVLPDDPAPSWDDPPRKWERSHAYDAATHGTCQPDGWAGVVSAPPECHTHQGAAHDLPNDPERPTATRLASGTRVTTPRSGRMTVGAIPFAGVRSRRRFCPRARFGFCGQVR